MPDGFSFHGDSIIVDMVRKFSQDRLLPLAAAPLSQNTCATAGSGR